MKTLANQTLLYDEDCPLCQAYTDAFVKTGMLDEKGRKPYADLNENELTFVNKENAVNEIALIDRENNTVTYGVDSLLKVIGYSFPTISKIGNIKPVKYLLKKLYSLVSYNRKVIVPGKSNNSELQCTPSFNYRYRFIYMLFATMVTAVTLFYYSTLLPIVPKGNFSREVILAVGQMAFQAIFLIKHDNKTILNYLGNVITVSLIGSLILLPVLLINSFMILPEVINLVWFGITVLIMFTEHYRRVKVLQLPGYLCFTWVAYRLLALPLILNL
ncbi:hypothetical protein GCM10007424_15800 [Flavobacterium suaedae]|uniref:DUF393 domain-containing protein n=1 Tax=Flavobacterium suaedae TaxID=1767027 RepID=A0ABQ1JUC0_9FLAO|nr:hypothetical protein [Flavobacterium suaedae]GGB76631.1 hypothetical protein GCM10007424_15800 [Flavobacterium suaedae]